ncbi:MAG: UTP--glucose-1-phosphate uridylyltransferase, partial [Lachnospiraceae bacterium]
MSDREERFLAAKERLEAYGQGHLLKFYEELSEKEQDGLVSQILSADFSVLSPGQLAADGLSRGVIAPISCRKLSEIEENRESFEAAGLSLLSEGRCAAVLLAGGMGTRLGFDGPKGSFDIGVTRPVFIFQRLIENLQETVQKVGRPLRLFVMTSEKNDGETRAFFRAHGFFGYPEAFVSFFVQDMAPCTDFDGKVLLEEKGRLATSPNGNGGWFLSLLRSEHGHLLKDEGIEWLNVFGVDNVLQRICDPAFVGATILGGYAVGSKVVRKVSPDEKVGVMCLEDGCPSVIEYSEMTP